ncbi:MAG: hypothetical protein WCR79_08210 [Fusobacterium sp.]
MEYVLMSVEERNKIIKKLNDKIREEMSKGFKEKMNYYFQYQEIKNKILATILINGCYTIPITNKDKMYIDKM